MTQTLHPPPQPTTSRRIGERLLPIGAALVVALVGVVAIVLVNGARDRGLQALERAKAAEIASAAASRDQQIAGFFSSTSALAAQPWDFQIGSVADLSILSKYQGPDARTGFFLLDPAGRVSQGILLATPAAIGSAYDHPGWAAVQGSPTYLAGRGAVLPVGPGLTSRVPVYAIALPVVDPRTGVLRGTFVAEGDVSADSSFNKEISSARRARTDELLIVDELGTVLAASRTDRLGRPIDLAAAGKAPGFHRAAGRVIVVGDVPAARWRLVFEQDRDEFQGALTQPLATVGRILLGALLLIGAAVFLLLTRRLKASREEQERLRQLHEQREEFVSIVSHELRTPVAGILGFLQTGLDHWDDLDDAERRSVVRRAATNARRLQALTRDVLETESVESGRLAFAFATGDLSEEVRLAADAAISIYEDHPITVAVPAEPVLARMDADRLQQVFTNLIDNAAKSSPSGSPIGLELTIDGGRAVVTVTDRGSGVDPDLAARMFDKFVRGRGSTVSGTGLGLYVCRLVVQAHGGSIAARTGAEGGAEFAVELPLGDPQPAGS